MKFTLTIEGDNHSDLAFITRQLAGSGVAAGVNHAVNVETVNAKSAVVGEIKPTTEAAPAKAGKAAGKKAEAAKPAPTEQAPAADEEELTSTDGEEAAATEEIDDESFLIAVRKFAQDTKIGGVAPTQAILAKFNDADGKPVARVNAVQKGDRAAVLAAIKDATDKATKKAK